MSRLIRLFLLFVFSFVALSVSAQKDSIPADLPKADNGEAPAMPISIEVGKSWYKGDSIPAVIFPRDLQIPRRWTSPTKRNDKTILVWCKT